MHALDSAQLRRAICNASRGHRSRMNLPDLDAVEWDALDVLGWIDPKAPQRGYLVVADEQGVAGVMVRAPESGVRRTAQCLLCHSVHSANIGLFVAPRAGASGTRGNTIGTYMCLDLSCSAHLRASLRPSKQLPDPAPVLAQRGAELQSRLRAFIASVERQ